ncbi:MAG: DUF2911 domain-containing protein [Gemmatimonadaceae bacterium]
MVNLSSGIMTAGRVATAVLFVALAAAPAGAQQTAPTGNAAFVSQPSGRARTTVELRRQAGDRTPVRITIDYGQPHARGRAILGNVIPFDAPWRTGANEATSLVTDVDLTIGGVVVPKGSYTLYTLPARSGWKLIINKNTGQWGTDYLPEHDLARVDLRSRQLREPLDSFSIWLVPEVERNESGGIRAGLPRGVLRLAWGDFELSTDWSVR